MFDTSAFHFAVVLVDNAVFDRPWPEGRGGEGGVAPRTSVGINAPFQNGVRIPK